MRADVVILDQVVAEIGGEIVPGGADVCEIGVAAVTARREFVRAQEAIACSSGIEARVNVED